MRPMTIGQYATLACLLEVSAPKPGNVHRAADFDDTTLNDFLIGAVAIGPAMESAAHRPVGRTILDAVRASRATGRGNINLGIILLLAPLAAVSHAMTLEAGLPAVLQGLSARDAIDVYQAIRQAEPGGLDPVADPIERYDVSLAPPSDLRAAMQDVADWDLVARQYVNDFQEVMRDTVPWLLEDADRLDLPTRIVQTHVRLMSQYPDSLIRRKCGRSTAEESAARAQAVLDAGPVGSDDYQRRLADLDFWLRSDGRRRNPGTTADLVAAGLFVALREQLIPFPLS